MADKNFRNGALNPNAFRRKEISEDEILNSPVLNYPLTQYMFCAPDEGAAAVIMCRGDLAHKYTDKPVYRARKPRSARARFGAYEVHATSAPLDEDSLADGVRGKRGIRGGRDRPRRRRHRPAAGHRRRCRSDPHGRDGTVRGRRAGEAACRRRHRDPRLACRSTPTAG